MTKGADDETEMEDGMTTSERRRRRRRGAGLRIPSDNVPRRTAPVPEDPAVAMSIAYAFSDDASGSGRLPTGDLEVDPDLGLDPSNDISDLGDMDDKTSIAPAPPVSADGSLPGLLSLDDVAPDGRTRQMAAVNLEALGLSDVESEVEAAASGSGGNTVDVDIDVDGIEDAPDGDGDGFDDDEEVPVARRPQTIPPPLPNRASDSGLISLTAATTAAGATATIATNLAAAAAATERTTADRPGERATAERATAERAPADRTTERVPAERASTDRATTDVEAPAAAVARAAKDDAAIAPRVGRAATVALSEDDLEELLEMTPPPRAAPLPPAATAAAIAAAAPAAVPEAISAAPSAPSTATSTPPPGAPLAPSMGNTTGEAVALAEEDLQEVATPSDAGDSGEILADEIVEVEQDLRAPVAAQVQSPGSAAATPAPHASPPTPPPAPAHSKPPAAPASKKPLAARHAQAAAASAAPAGDPEARKKRRGKPWFEEVFDEDYLRTLPFLTPQATQAEALMVIESLGVPTGAAVLDIGCGYGRHAMELAARGYHVVGVDLSLPLLLRGADEAQRRGLDINFVHADMREMDFDAQFDGAYCLFSTFGFFDDETNKKTASLIAKALKPGAKFMLEILNRDYVTADLPARVWWEGDGCVVLEEVEFNYFSSRVQSKRSVVFDDGRQVEQEISLRVYSLHEVGKLLHAAGLRVLEVSGSMASRGRFLGTRSREIIVVAERRPPDGKT